MDLRGQDGRDRGDPGPVSTLLEFRTELALTDSQVVALERIDDEMDTTNAPLVAQMMEIRSRIRSLGPRRRMDREERRLYESYVAEARPLIRQIERNNRSAMHDVGRLLTATQKATMSRLLKQRDPDREQSGRSSRPPDRGN